MVTKRQQSISPKLNCGSVLVDSRPSPFCRHRGIHVSRRFPRRRRMKNIQMMDGAVNAACTIFGVTEDTAFEDPGNCKRSRSVGVWLGLTTRRYQSGEVDYNGHISRRGDTNVRSLPYEAATVILTRSTAESTLVRPCRVRPEALSRDRGGRDAGRADRRPTSSARRHFDRRVATTAGAAATTRGHRGDRQTRAPAG